MTEVSRLVEHNGNREYNFYQFWQIDCGLDQKNQSQLSPPAERNLYGLHRVCLHWDGRQNSFGGITIESLIEYIAQHDEVFRSSLPPAEKIGELRGMPVKSWMGKVSKGDKKLISLVYST